MKVAEYNSIAEAPGVMNKDAEDNSIAEILGDDIFCDSILLFNVFNVSSWGGKYRVRTEWEKGNCLVRSL